MLSNLKKKIDEKKSNKTKEVKNEQQLQEQPRPKLLTQEVSYRITEAYKTARTNILFALKKKDSCNIVAVTSAIPGEGKTTSTLNLAISFAMTNVKVLVIDADLRKPRVHKYAELPNDNGLANYLGGFCELDKCIQKNKQLGLDCITSGSVPPNPTELLSSPLLKEGLDILTQKYDYIFIDTPPVNVVTDGIIVSKLVDAVLLVARQKYTAHEALKKVLSSLTFAEANVVGFIMNDAEEQSQKYKYNKYKYRYRRRYYGYGYGKYYKYYKYKSSDYREYK